MMPTPPVSQGFGRAADHISASARTPQFVGLLELARWPFARYGILVCVPSGLDSARHATQRGWSARLCSVGEEAVVIVVGPKPIWRGPDGRKRWNRLELYCVQCRSRVLAGSL